MSPTSGGTATLICCGSGGVGKTTASAALALKWALEGQRVAVLTIDPARRLADSLSIGEIGNAAVPVPLPPGARGSLDAMMLDAKATFDELVRRLAPTDAAARRILANRYYQFASTRLGGAHEYMAMERLYELWHGGRYDVVVVDTPPTRHALDFLRAPERMASLMDEGVLRWLILPAGRSGWRALELGSEAVASVLKRVLGEETAEEIAEFFDVFRDLWEGFRRRSLEVQSLLHGPRTRFLLISSPAPSAREDAVFFLQQLQARELPFGGFIVNRSVRPPAPLDPLPVAPDGVDPAAWERARRALEQAWSQRRNLALDHQRSVEALRAAGPPGAPCWWVPEQPDDLHDLAGLVALGPHLPERAALALD